MRRRSDRVFARDDTHAGAAFLASHADIQSAWEPIKSQWEEMFQRLRAAQACAWRLQHCNVRLSWERDPKLGAWVGTQRLARKHDKSDAERVTRLDRLGSLGAAQITSYAPVNSLAWSPAAAASGFSDGRSTAVARYYCREVVGALPSAAPGQSVAEISKSSFPVNLLKPHGFRRAPQLRWAAWNESKPARVDELDDSLRSQYEAARRRAADAHGVMDACSYEAAILLDGSACMNTDSHLHRHARRTLVVTQDGFLPRTCTMQRAAGVDE
jgi:hypothetical protein